MIRSKDRPGYAGGGEEKRYIRIIYFCIKIYIFLYSTFFLHSCSSYIRHTFDVFFIITVRFLYHNCSSDIYLDMYFMSIYSDECFRLIKRINKFEKITLTGCRYIAIFYLQ